MKKKFKVTLVVFLVVVLGCFSQVFAATNQNNKADKISQVRKNMRFLDSTTTSSSAENEEVDQYTKLLMHMDDSTFKDECGNAVTNNGVTLDTTTKKLSSGSAYFNGSSTTYLSSILDGLNNKYTIDFWFNLKSNTGTSIFFTSNDGASLNARNTRYFGYKNGSFVIIGNGDTQVCSFGTYSINTNQWYHCAYEWDGTNTTLYINGNNIKSITSNYLLRYFVKIGSDYYNYHYFNGNIDEFRISNVDRWTSDFNPTVPDNVVATGISLNNTTDSLILNNSIKGTDTLIATVTPDSATNKTVAWKSSDENIVYVDPVTGKITARGKGTVTITATTTDGSNLSASCVVTVTDSNNPTDNSDKAVLNITMTNGQVKRYNLTMDAVNKFISWYRLRSAGSGDPFYEFDITQTSSPSIIKTDYVVFDKISSFEVDDYTK